jgi:inosine-uridine nucleoside N-ribohydrolase
LRTSQDIKVYISCAQPFKPPYELIKTVVQSDHVRTHTVSSPELIKQGARPTKTRAYLQLISLHSHNALNKYIIIHEGGRTNALGRMEDDNITGRG